MTTEDTLKTWRKKAADARCSLPIERNESNPTYWQLADMVLSLIDLVEKQREVIRQKNHRLALLRLKEEYTNEDKTLEYVTRQAEKAIAIPTPELELE